MKNLDIASIFHSIAQILEIKGENPFRIRAYERASQVLNGAQGLEEYLKAGNLADIPGIGQDLAMKIKEYFSTGKIKQFEELKKEVPQGLLDLLKIPSVGPKTAKLFYEKLKIKDILTLEKFAKEGKLLTIEGVKEKTVENILNGIALVKKGKERLDIGTAWEIADKFAGELKKLREIDKIAVAGSLRRMKETVKDIDILLTSTHPQIVMDVFCSCEEVKKVIAKGTTKSSILSKEGIQVDARVVEPNSFSAALLYFTGSKAHNIRLRSLAVKKGLKINEYGIFRGEKCIASKTEEEIYNLLGMQYIEPELREDNGEISAALDGKLPNLVKLEDIKGDLHSHSTYSDGANSILEMACAAQKRGYEYLVLTDHSQGLKVAHGLSVKDLRRKKKEIDSINKKIKNFVVLYGSETEINSQGDIDYKDEILKEFDFVVAAIHTGLKQTKEQLTKRIIKACKNPNVDIIAHPTGRLWGTRDSYEIDFDEVFKAAYDTNTFLEINAFPLRLDLNDINIRMAKEKGVRFAIGTDSHSTEHLNYMRYGVSAAKRGWLEKKNIINTFSLEQILKIKK